MAHSNRSGFSLLAIAIFGLVSIGEVGRAEACGSGGGGDMMAALVVVGGGYVGVTAGFATGDLASKNHSTGYGVAETLIHTPFTALWGTLFVRSFIPRPPPCDGCFERKPWLHDHRTELGLLTMLHASLAAHGIWTIARNARRRSPHGPPPPAAFRVGPVQAVVTAQPIANGAALGLTGSF